jgi:hypothetical protein
MDSISIATMQFFRISAGLLTGFGMGLFLIPRLFIKLYSTASPMVSTEAWVKALGGDLVLFGIFIVAAARAAHPSKIGGLRNTLSALFAAGSVKWLYLIATGGGIWTKLAWTNVPLFAAMCCYGQMLREAEGRAAED